MALWFVTKQPLLPSTAGSTEVTFNENVSHSSLPVYLFVEVFIKIKFGISRGISRPADLLKPDYVLRARPALSVLLCWCDKRLTEECIQYAALV